MSLAPRSRIGGLVQQHKAVPNPMAVSSHGLIIAIDSVSMSSQSFHYKLSRYRSSLRPAPYFPTVSHSYIVSERGLQLLDEQYRRERDRLQSSKLENPHSHLMGHYSNLPLTTTAFADPIGVHSILHMSD